MNSNQAAHRAYALPMLLLVYCAASFIHFAHNALFIDAYPNLPAWLSSTDVVLSWLGITAIGAVGYAIFRRGYRFVGLLMVGVYGALGLDGLAHYTRAPIAAHSFTMNFTIGFEVCAAMSVLIAVAALMLRQLRGLRPVGP